MITSNWKLTFDPSGTPLVLVDFGEFIEDEIEPSVGQQVEVVSLVDASFPFLRVGKNATVEFTFRVIRETASTDAAARAGTGSRTTARIIPMFAHLQ